VTEIKRFLNATIRTDAYILYRRRYQGSLVILYSRLLLFAALGAFAPVVVAQDCARPDGFTETRNIYVSTSWTGAADTPCALRAELSTGAPTLASGFAANPFAGTVSQVRLRFAVDYSELVINSILKSATIVSIVGSEAPAASSAQLLRLALNGIGGVPNLSLIYPDVAAAPSAPGYTARNVVLNGTGSAQIGIDLQLGSSGYIRYWIDADFDAPPTGRIPTTGYLDFSARGNATGLSMGMFWISQSFRSANASKALVISDIKVDDYLFWSGYE